MIGLHLERQDLKAIMRESRICWFVVLLAKKEDFLKAPDNGGPKATKGVVVSASMLSADFANLSASVGAVEAAGADWLHVDVMDGCFVPSITVGPVVIAGIKKCTRLVLDVHLMVKAPASHLRSVIDAGADIITVHAESDVHLYRFVREVKSHGKKVGVSLVPKTHHSALEYVIHELDLVLVMSVDPGFGGQEFLTSQLRKIEKIRTMVEKYSLQTKISVDGGVTTENVGSIVNAGADVVVVGTSLFKSANMCKVVQTLKSF
ncbi:MAG: ribulose-phosphate 3-epimerase [Anaplasma ovis]|nr:ribulose-phosphate 3-epimerase [Anaplasma ovis]